MRITLDIPQHVYDKLTKIAETTDRSVEDILIEQAASVEPDESTFYRHPEHDKMQREVEYFDSHVDELWQTYPNQFVAVFQQQVVDHDVNKSALLRRIRTTHSGAIVLIRQVTGQPTPTYRVYSPRLIRNER